MKTTLMIATVLAAGTSAVYAQEPPAAQQVPTPPGAEAAATPAPARSAPASPERIREMKIMENILANAVSQGASDLAHQMQQMDPGSVIPGSVTVSPAHARGIELDGYGVLFDVDVPLMNMSVVWTRRQMFVQNLRDQISESRRELAHTTSPDSQARLEAQIQMLTTQLSVMAPLAVAEATAPAAPSPAIRVAESTAQPAPGAVMAATTEIAPATPLETRSTNELYTDSIKTALMQAMVNHSSALMIGDDEWLLVAARDNGPTVPGTIDERSGIILRIKGSDLAAFRANKLSRDEVIKKIEIREWR